MTEDEIRERLREAIESVLGPGTPYVLVYDDTPMDEVLDGGGTYTSFAEPTSQPAYVSVGLLHMAEASYMPKEAI